MKYSYRWIKELSGTKKSTDQLSKLLLTHAFEVEGIEKFSHGLDGVVVGRVAEVSQHPNADKLRVAEVEVGKNDIRTIVCGAPNLALGQKVAVALPGVKLPGGIEIQIATLRGVESNGMICSEKELGLGNSHAGILVLPEETPVGAPFAKYFDFDDSILEVKILPDRGSDALAYQGLAREIAALDGHAPKLEEKGRKTLRIPSYNRAPKVVITAKKECPRYVGLYYKGVTVSESPLWLKSKLIVSGLRPINNIVDATNYLMLLTGQPMHAFDADKISGGVFVRNAKKNEKLKVLNGEVLKLSPEDVVIADSKKALALAGVMGGLDSSVTENTTNIFIEIANFDGSTVRRTKNRHNLPTDASYRYERNLDPNLPKDAMCEAADIIPDLTGGKLMGMRDIYPKKFQATKILLSIDRVENVLGTKIPLFEAVQYLALLGLGVKKVTNQKVLSVTVPTRRPDLRDEWDLIEEIGRMHGYDKISAEAPALPLSSSEKNPLKQFEREVKEYLASAGFDEVLTYSFYGDKEIAAARLPLDHHLVIENPLSPDQKYMAMTSIPLMLRKAGENMKNFTSFDIFEWSSAFAKNQKTKLPVEVKSLGLLSVMPKKSEKGEAFFAMKGRVEALFEALHIERAKITYELPEKFPHIPVLAMLHPTRSVCMVKDGIPFGIMGEFHPTVLKAFGLEPRLAMAGFVAEELAALQEKEVIFTPLQKFPYALRDISLTFPSTNEKSVTVANVEAILNEAGAPLLQKCELFDIYEQNGEKSFAFHLSFGASDRTLSGAEMDAAFDRIVLLAGERLSGRLR